MSQFEKEALERLSNISKPVYDKFQRITVTNPVNRAVLEKLFTTARKTITQIDFEIRIKDLPKTPEQLGI